MPGVGEDVRLGPVALPWATGPCYVVGAVFDLRRLCADFSAISA